MFMTNRSLAMLSTLFALLLGTAPARAEAPSNPIAAIVAKVTPAVVEIVVVRPPKTEDAKPETNVAQASASSGRRVTAIGSGFIIDKSGFVATNKHVVEDAISVFVATSDGIRYKAKIVGVTDKSDIALLKIDAGKDLAVVPWGDSNKVQVGDTVIAIGSPFGFDTSVSSGIVSAVDRDIMESPFDDYIQTDAAINHGNSGGPLFNLAGEVIGMNSVLFAPGDLTGSIGLGFAIPSSELTFVLNRLMTTGKINAGMLPIRTQQVTWLIAQAIHAPGLHGALVASLTPGGDDMMEQKIKPGDIILDFNGEMVLDPRDLARKAAMAPIGSDAVLTICRVGVQQIVHVKIQPWPEAKAPEASRFEPHSLGLELAAATSDGVMVATVDPLGTAADSGLQKGDIILQVQQQPVSSPEQAKSILDAMTTKMHASYAALLVQRDDKRTWIAIAVPE
jgi:serine protease Do